MDSDLAPNKGSQSPLADPACNGNWSDETLHRTPSSTVPWLGKGTDAGSRVLPSCWGRQKVECNSVGSETAEGARRQTVLECEVRQP